MLTKLLSLRERFGPLLSSVTGMMGGGGPSEDQILGKIDELKGAGGAGRKEQENRD